MMRTISTTWRRELSSSFFFLQGKAPKETHAILTETYGEYASSYVTVKNWVAQFKCGGFSTCDAPRPGQPKTVTTLEIINHLTPNDPYMGHTASLTSKLCILYIY